MPYALGLMLTISVNFGVPTRNWLKIDIQPLKFNFKLYFWGFRGTAFCRVSEKSQNSKSLCSSPGRNSGPSSN